MSGLIQATEAFFDQLTSIVWASLGLALICHVLKVGARTRAWRNILVAAYPGARIRWRDVFGAYVAGVGINGLVPARAGDVLKLYLVKSRIEGSTYPTLASTLAVDTLFDTVVSLLLLSWALSLGLLPGLDVLPSLPSIDWLWLFRYPWLAAGVAFVLVVGSFVLGVWSARHIANFRRRVAQGFTILRTPRLYLRRVVAWQALDWGFRLGTLFFFLDAFNIPATLHNAILVQLSAGLSTIFPFTPGGVGTEQALLVYVLAGVASTSALLSFSIGMKLVLVVFNALLAFSAIALMLKTLRWRGLVERDRLTEPDVPSSPA